MSKILTAHEDALPFVENARARLQVTLAEKGNLCVGPLPRHPEPLPPATLAWIAEELSVYYGRPLHAKLYPSPLALLEDRVDPVRVLGALQGHLPHMAWQEALSHGFGPPPRVPLGLVGGVP